MECKPENKLVLTVSHASSRIRSTVILKRTVIKTRGEESYAEGSSHGNHTECDADVSGHDQRPQQ